MGTSIEETSFSLLQGTEMNIEAAFPPKPCSFSDKLSGITALNNLVFIFASLSLLTVTNSEFPRCVNFSSLSCRHSTRFPYVLFQLITLSLLSSAYHHVNIKPKPLKFLPISS
jgi:hypothetical protein